MYIMRTVLIIGAGFSGVACAVQLLRRCGRAPLRILLLNRSGRMGRGLAYGTHSPQHMLNVPAGKMSALPDDALHFLRYARWRDRHVQHDSFVARSVYGDYLEWTLREALAAAPRHATLDCIGGTACGLRCLPGGAIVAALQDGRQIRADKVVLALGHCPPGDPPVADMSFYASPRYQRDPWDAALLDALPAAGPVLLLGTGLTAIDIALGLLGGSPARRIYAVSRHGLLPQAYAAPHALSWQSESCTVRGALSAFRGQARALGAAGHSWHDAMAAIRCQVATIWQAWPPAERRRFMRHVQPYWDVHRHQLPPAALEQINAAMERGALRVLAGHVLGYREGSEGVDVQLRPRGRSEEMELDAVRVINCTGPCARVRNSSDPMVMQLLADGMMCTDSIGLGIDTGPACSVLDAQGRAVPGLHYLGPWLRAQHWEATAVPELRTFAEQAALACLA
jgi:uncharacterized NAD(P)/FAD-binding protein YdhS